MPVRRTLEGIEHQRLHTLCIQLRKKCSDLTAIIDILLDDVKKLKKEK